MGPIHRSRRRTFKVDPLAVITAAMTRTLELVFAWLPIRSAAQVRAACVNDEYPVRSSIHPNAIFLLKFSVNAQSKIGGVADFKDCAGLKQCARQEEPEERDKPCAQESNHATPHQPATSLIHLRILRSRRSEAPGRGSFGSPHRRRANIRSRRAGACGCRCDRRDWHRCRRRTRNRNCRSRTGGRRSGRS